jgi:succinyl-CoA synthetase alpha subunit
MSILIDERTKVLVQGITGRDGSFHTKQMIDYGTIVVGGVTPGKGGMIIETKPVFSNVGEAVKYASPDASVIFVPAKYASGAIREAADNCIKLIICITEGLPVLEMLENYYYVKDKGCILIGPNCPGIISPGKSKIGIMPGKIHKEGNIGVISRSGTLTYEVVYNLTLNGFGQSTCIGIGGDPITGTGFIDILKLFNEDPQTDGVVIIGEIGGDEEGKAALWMKDNFKKKAVVFISGRTAPRGKRMGHAGAIISGNKETAESKIEAFKSVNIPVADRPDEIPYIMKELPGIDHDK